MKRLILASIALALSACVTTPAVTTGAAPAVASTTPARTAAVRAVADTAVTVADALQVAPPATLTAKVMIDDKAIRIAFRTFDAALTVIDQLRATPLLVPGTPRALAVQSGIRTAQRWLNAASAAQRIGDAASYRDALRQSEVALAALGVTLDR